MANGAILNIDIFKPSQNSRSMRLPKYSEKVIHDLQRSLRSILQDTLNNSDKMKVSDNNSVSKVLSELQTSVNSILEKKLAEMKTHQISPKLIKLSELYGFACRNNATIKKYLNSFYLTSRVYKGLLKKHVFIQDLQFRLLNVRRKAILETYKNDISKGKLHHLKYSKSSRIISTLPKKLKDIVRKINKEMVKYLSKDGACNMKSLLELKHVAGEDAELTSRSLCESIEESFIDYYGEVHIDLEKTEGYIQSLKEISEAQNMEGEQVLLNYCDQEMAMEYLCLESDEVRKDYQAWDELARHDNQLMTVSKSIVQVERTIQISLTDEVVINNNLPDSKMNIFNDDILEEVDVDDFEDFQLVDEWDNKHDNDSQTANNDAALNKVNQNSKIDDQNNRPHKRKRTRFGPVSEEFLIDQMQQGSLGFSSTFVDEEENSNKTAKVGKVENIVRNDIKKGCGIKVSGAVPKELNDTQLKSSKEVIPEPELVIKKVVPEELCQSMLKQFRDSLKSIVKLANDNKTDHNIPKSWTLKQPYSHAATSSVLETLSTDIYNDIETKMTAIVQKYSDKRQKLNFDNSSEICDIIKLKEESSPKINTPKAYSNINVARGHSPKSNINNKYNSKSPNIQPGSPKVEKVLNIEPNPTTSRKVISTPSYPLVAPRPNKSDTSICPDKSRLRAIMLSYKRDVKKALDNIQDVAKNLEDKNIVSEEEKLERGKVDNQQVDVMKGTSDQDVQVKAELKDGQTKKKRKYSGTDENSDGEISSSEEEKVEKKDNINKQKQSKVKWLARHSDTVVSIPLPAPAAPFLENLADTDDSQKWNSRKVFVLDAQDTKNAVAISVKDYLKSIGACVFDSSNYKQAGKGLHVLIHNDWHYPDPIIAAPFTSPISLLFLKNNSGVHFLSYSDLDMVMRFECATVFPHSRSCLFLDQKSLLNTHPDNIRNMLDFMITERETSDRIWCLKIVSGVYSYFCDQIVKSENEDEISRLKTVRSILDEYSSRYKDEESLSLVEIVKEEEDITKQQEQVLNQQYFLQKKFRHFCILTDNLNTTELDIRFLSTYGIAVLPLHIFLTNKIKNFVS